MNSIEVQLTNENEALRQRVAALEAAETRRQEQFVAFTKGVIGDLESTGHAAVGKLKAFVDMGYHSVMAAHSPIPTPAPTPAPSAPAPALEPTTSGSTGVDRSSTHDSDTSTQEEHEA